MPSISEDVIAGVSLAFLSAFLFGLNSVVARVAGQRFSESAMLPASLFIGMVFSASYMLVSSKTLVLSSVAAYIFSGVANFVIARFFFFKAVRRIGAGSTALVISGNVIVTALISAIILGEAPSALVLVGMIFFLFGVVIASLDNVKKSTDSVGLASAFLAMLFVALVNISIRYANLGKSDPLLGVFISYASAFTVLFILRRKLTIDSLRIVIEYRDRWLIMLGVLPLLAQTTRFLSLDHIPAYLAAPILSTSTFFALLTLLMTPSAREKVTLRKVLGVIIGFIGIGISLVGG